METLNLSIDGKEVKAKQGSTVLAAALDNEIYIPSLCFHPHLSATGGCRLCVVEIEGYKDYVPSCTISATDSMVVRTSTPQLLQLRREALNPILSQHPCACLMCWRQKKCGPDDICLRNVAVTDRCVTCPRNYNCELQQVVCHVNKNDVKIEYSYRNLPIDDSNPFFARDLNRCILCGRCSRVCNEIRGIGAVNVYNWGGDSLNGPFGSKPIFDTNCISCGACVSSCPVGALYFKDSPKAETETKTTCTYCGVGCGLVLGTRENKVINVYPDKESEVNKGYLCVKGHFAIKEMVHHPDRLTVPLINCGGQFSPVNLDEALNIVASRLRNYRSDEVAVISSSKCTNEDNYVAQKFARVVLGTNNVDNCARL